MVQSYLSPLSLWQTLLSVIRIRDRGPRISSGSPVASSGNAAVRVTQWGVSSACSAHTSGFPSPTSVRCHVTG